MELYLRHGNDHEIQPVPGVSEEGEAVYTETSSHNLCEWLECVDPREGVSDRLRKKEHHFLLSESLPFLITPKT